MTFIQNLLKLFRNRLMDDYDFALLQERTTGMSVQIRDLRAENTALIHRLETLEQQLAQEHHELVRVIGEIANSMNSSRPFHPSPSLRRMVTEYIREESPRVMHRAINASLHEFIGQPNTPETRERLAHAVQASIQASPIAEPGFVRRPADQIIAHMAAVERAIENHSMSSRETPSEPHTVVPSVAINTVDQTTVDPTTGRVILGTVPNVASRPAVNRNGDSFIEGAAAGRLANGDQEIRIVAMGDHGSGPNRARDAFPIVRVTQDPYYPERLNIDARIEADGTVHQVSIAAPRENHIRRIVNDPTNSISATPVNERPDEAGDRELDPHL